MPVFPNKATSFAEGVEAKALRQRRIEQAHSEARFDMARRFVETKIEEARESLRADIE